MAESKSSLSEPCGPACQKPSWQARLRHWVLLAGLVTLLLALDQFTKWLVVRNLAVNEAWAPVPALAKVFTITHVQNTGIAFGQLHGLGWVFMVVNAVVLIGVIAYFPRIPAPLWSLRLASGLILAGDLGNVIDRIRSAARLAHEASSFWKALPGASVTDMFDFKVWPVFNVADMSLVAGIIIVGWVMWRMESRSRPASEPVVTEDAQSASDDRGPQ